ncbi:hypothetical protein LTR99_001806 [Exophiala xenobiotica]|uniref:Elongator complex protein 5 n=1 Tax=Vermiconidia calcicola TaxID=1690605 RepID=A0AAV9QAK8_9PEZI|nr:hypothetical protein LTR96_002044 [Exophiala xenobiotica]KAK5536574.1 hypothetical protein LTR25_005248 [Vermiconidia calcicola]KAK5543285.1 hypothetical protein LTR23_004762 [Chaetothyriales sp. CCFEE 6169]KAK5306116.1 hypothetical protein LTR99_001806 [Exophiala xenobiotica]KAK5341904.1 hypothetical protein LTR98_002698 [Exophiala xenobiotica]
MAQTNLSHRRTHNLLLISKLLNQRDHASPFTLVLDTLEQTAKPLIREYLRRSRLSKTSTIFLAFETIIKPRDVDHFIECYDESKSPERIAREVMELLARSGSKRHLIIIDSLTTLASISTNPASRLNLTAFLSSLLQPPQQPQRAQQAQEQPQISLVGVYHTDIPLPSSPPSTTSTSYLPSPLSLLSYLATTIITVHSLPILLAEQAARARSLVAPAYGLAEETEGVLIGFKPKRDLKLEERGLVLELEHRRKSGRGVLEWYFLPSTTKAQQPSSGPHAFREIITLLDDHPLFRKPKEDENVDQQLSGMTFELGLTERQRLEREGVVLPYFDAQKAGGGGEGGRILYDMGVEDDFDEEEDEI